MVRARLTSANDRQMATNRPFCPTLEAVTEEEVIVTDSAVFAIVNVVLPNARLPQLMQIGQVEVETGLSLWSGYGEEMGAGKRVDRLELGGYLGAHLKTARTDGGPERDQHIRGVGSEGALHRFEGSCDDQPDGPTPSSVDRRYRTGDRIRQ